MRGALADTYRGAVTFAATALLASHMYGPGKSDMWHDELRSVARYAVCNDLRNMPLLGTLAPEVAWTAIALRSRGLTTSIKEIYDSDRRCSEWCRTGRRPHADNRPWQDR